MYVKLEVHVFQNLEEISYLIANYLVKEAEAAISKRGIFTFALSGGKNPEEAALIYEYELCDFFRNKTEKEDNSTFDVILLGIGEDGHTASLFPNSSCLDEKKRWVVSSEAPPSFSQKKRITLTFPAINRSRKAVFLAAGSEKREVVTAILKNQPKTTRLYPAAQVCPMENLLWYVDDQAL